MMADGSTHRASSYSTLSRSIASASSEVSCAVNASATSAQPWSAANEIHVRGPSLASTVATMHAATNALHLLILQDAMAASDVSLGHGGSHPLRSERPEQQTCGLLSSLLPKQRHDAEEVEALWIKRQASLPLHIPDSGFCRCLSSLHASPFYTTAALASIHGKLHYILSGMWCGCTHAR